MRPSLCGTWILICGFACFTASDVPSRTQPRTRLSRSGEAYFTEDLYSVPPALQKRLNAVFAIDFNRDAFPDLIALQTDPAPASDPDGGAPILAYANDGRGHFVESTAQVLGDVRGTGSQCYRVADFNGDKLDDVLLVDPGSGRQANFGQGKGYHFLIQKPNGTLTDESSARLPAFDGEPHWAAEGDIDGDGDLDVIVTSAGGPDYVLLVNDGQGHFTDETARLPAAKPGWIPDNCLMLDVDRDGYPDIFVGEADGVSPRDFLFMNDGTGHFSFAPDQALPLRLLGLGSGTSSAFAADFNGDGWMDLALCCLKTPATAIQLLYNNGDGTFRDASNQIVSSWPVTRLGDFGRRTGDVNGDGWPDLLAAREVWPGSNAPLLMVNHAGASMEDVSQAVWGFHGIGEGEPPSGEFADIDNDGDLDVIGVYPASDGIHNQIYVLVNQSPYPIPEAPLPLPSVAALRSPEDGAIIPSNQVLLSWDDVPTAFAYRLQLAKESTFTQVLSERQVTTNIWPPTGYAVKTTVTWRVRAVNSRGVGAWSRGRYFIVAFPAYPPIEARLERVTFDYAFFKVLSNARAGFNVCSNRLSWKPDPRMANALSGFRIYRKAKEAAESAWALVAELPASAIGYNDRMLRRDQLFTYRITAVNSQGFASVPAVVGN
jgi:hypothetical protein